MLSLLVDATWETLCACPVDLPPFCFVVVPQWRLPHYVERLIHTDIKPKELSVEATPEQRVQEYFCSWEPFKGAIAGPSRNWLPRTALCRCLGGVACVVLHFLAMCCSMFLLCKSSSAVAFVHYTCSAPARSQHACICEPIVFVLAVTGPVVVGVLVGRGPLLPCPRDRHYSARTPKGPLRVHRLHRPVRRAVRWCSAVTRR